MGAIKQQIEKNCEHCKKPFYANTFYTKYCSDKCASAAVRARKREKLQEERRKEQAALIPGERAYITIAEAVTLFGISRDTIYRLIRNGKIPAINLGERLTRISRPHIESMFKEVVLVPKQKAVEAPRPTLYSFEPKDCYTIGEITEKFSVGATTVYTHIRKEGIPTCQKGKYVYVPKSELDRLYKVKK